MWKSFCGKVAEVVIALSKLDKIRRKIRKLTPTEFMHFVSQTMLEVLFTMPNQQNDDIVDHRQDSVVGPLPQCDNSQLISYEELSDEDFIQDSLKFQRSLRSMHHYIPHHPFRATVRMTPVAAATSAVVLDGQSQFGNLQVAQKVEAADSPASFPSTPFSRMEIMNRTTEKVDSVMFAARDRLRLEAQSVSRDEFSRRAAFAAQSSGQMAIFDPSQTSSGVALTCGNHCAAKVGNGLCSCCRSMVSVMFDTFVYIEFSVTVSNGQVPSFGIGLSPPDCPLNVMVGSWPSSVGIYTDGQMLVGSHWFQPLARLRFDPGCTVGMLVYVGSSSSSSSSGISDPIGSRPADTTSRSGEEEVVVVVVVEEEVDHSEEEEDGKERIEKQPNIVIFNLNGRTISQPILCKHEIADIVYRSRAAIGAPSGCRVYCLDGSLLLREDE
eukprot:gene23202-31523_t